MRMTLWMFYLLPALLFAQGCIVGNQPSKAKYVCIDGRSATCTAQGIVWNAKRGCFLSAKPCCAYQADHYGFYAQPKQLYAAYEQCRVDYPFHLGEFQTH